MPDPHGKFNKSEQEAFAPGGELSTHDQRTEEPASHFLMPKERKYPYMMNGRISCNMLKAAIVRSAQHGHNDVNRKAKEMYDDHCA